MCGALVVVINVHLSSVFFLSFVFHFLSHLSSLSLSHSTPSVHRLTLLHLTSETTSLLPLCHVHLAEVSLLTPNSNNNLWGTSFHSIFP